MSIVNELAGNSFIIFCGTCNSAQRVALLLRNLGITAIPLHGQMSQVRLSVCLSTDLSSYLSGFQKGQAKEVLVLFLEQKNNQ